MTNRRFYFKHRYEKFEIINKNITYGPGMMANNKSNHIQYKI